MAALPDLSAPRREASQATRTDGVGDGVTYTRGNARDVYEGRLVRALRHCVKIDAETYVLVDDLAAPAPATFSWLIHSLDKMTVSAEKNAIGLGPGRKATSVTVAVPADVPVGPARWRARWSPHWVELKTMRKGDALTFKHPGVAGELILGERK